MFNTFLTVTAWLLVCGALIAMACNPFVDLVLRWRKAQLNRLRIGQ